MPRPEAAREVLLRDQRRALYAYQSVDSVSPEDWNDYQLAVYGLGANVLRSGLCAALAAVQRFGTRGDLLLDHLAKADLPALESIPTRELVQRVRALDTDVYLIAARETLQVATWLKRAAQARSRSA